MKRRLYILNACFLGLPSISVTTAENQIELSKVLHGVKVIYFAGLTSTLNSESFLEVIRRIIADSELREEFRSNSLKLEVSTTTSEMIDYLCNIT